MKSRRQWRSRRAENAKREKQRAIRIWKPHSTPILSSNRLNVDTGADNSASKVYDDAPLVRGVALVETG